MGLENIEKLFNFLFYVDIFFEFQRCKNPFYEINHVFVDSGIHGEEPYNRYNPQNLWVNLIRCSRNSNVIQLQYIIQ